MTKEVTEFRKVTEIETLKLKAFLKRPNQIFNKAEISQKNFELTTITITKKYMYYYSAFMHSKISKKKISCSVTNIREAYFPLILQIYVLAEIIRPII